ncbi:MAG: hypothetical protein GON13_00135 [Nanoarchaeota archaeon]|nr:hypothetical protein [Nanoarchaeota archaeon]
MVKIINFAHFFRDKRSVLEVNGELPSIVNNFPKDGALMLSISNEAGERKAFKLTIEEASRMIISLESFLKKHESEISKLWH